MEPTHTALAIFTAAHGAERVVAEYFHGDYCVATYRMVTGHAGQFWACMATATFATEAAARYVACAKARELFGLWFRGEDQSG